MSRLPNPRPVNSRGSQPSIPANPLPPPAFALETGREAALLRCVRCEQALGVRLTSGRLKLFQGPELESRSGRLYVECAACGKTFYLRLNHNHVVRVADGD